MTTRMRGEKCRRCDTYPDEHTKNERGSLRCPDGSGAYLKHSKRKATGQSFVAREVDLLHFIVTGIANGKDVRAARRHPEFSRVARKIMGMREKHEQMAKAAETPKQESQPPNVLPAPSGEHGDLQGTDM